MFDCGTCRYEPTWMHSSPCVDEDTILGDCKCENWYDKDYNSATITIAKRKLGYTLNHSYTSIEFCPNHMDKDSHCCWLTNFVCSIFAIVWIVFDSIYKPIKNGIDKVRNKI